jgi:hypothetical protein
MTEADDLAELRGICPAASYLAEGGCSFVSLPCLQIGVDDRVLTRDALLSLGAHTGYTSRLYLSDPIPDRGANWTIHTVLGRSWHTPSWNQVAPGRPIEMLQQHLRMYR